MRLYARSGHNAKIRRMAKEIPTVVRETHTLISLAHNTIILLQEDEEKKKKTKMKSYKTNKKKRQKDSK